MTSTDSRMLQAAAFLRQALEIDDDPATLAPDLTEVSRDDVVAVFATELDSSVGPAAFLIYVYDLTTSDDTSGAGQRRFDTDLATLETAARRDAPGPRLVAHAAGETEAFLLATSPATLRALSGEARTGTAVTGITERPEDDPTTVRRAAAGELLRLLRDANVQAESWLGAVGDLESLSRSFPGSDEETGLALLLLDDRSISPLLRTLNAIISTARAIEPASTPAAPGSD